MSTPIPAFPGCPKLFGTLLGSFGTPNCDQIKGPPPSINPSQQGYSQQHRGEQEWAGLGLPRGKAGMAVGGARMALRRVRMALGERRWAQAGLG